MSFDFAVNDSSSTVPANNHEAVEVVNPDFESNEVADIYLTSGDYKATLGKMLEALDLDALKIYSDDTLEDVSRLLGEYSDAHPMQKLHMVASLFKSTAGKMQRDNDHSIGLEDGKAPDEDYNEGFSYAFHNTDLSSITWEDLDGGERESLEEMGIDPSELGFDSNYGGPKILAINGERLPIAVEDGNEVMEALDILQQVPDEPSAWTEDGLRESSDPSVFGDVDTDKVAAGGSSGGDEGVDYINNPDRIGEVGANQLRSGEGSVREINSLRTIQTLLARESDGKARSTVMKALKERRSTLQNDSGDGADTETDEAASDSDDSESVENVENGTEPSLKEVVEVYDLTDFEKSGVEYRVESGKADSYREAAEQLA